jgi:hypothetical protein
MNMGTIFGVICMGKSVDQWRQLTPLTSNDVHKNASSFLTCLAKPTMHITNANGIFFKKG